MITLEERLNLLVEAYYGIMEMDEYDLKVYELKKLEEEIDNFKNEYNIKDFDYEKPKNVSLKTKLQSSLIVLNENNGPLELILLIKRRLKDINE